MHCYLSNRCPGFTIFWKNMVMIDVHARVLLKWLSHCIDSATVQVEPNSESFSALSSMDITTTAVAAASSLMPPNTCTRRCEQPSLCCLIKIGVFNVAASRNGNTWFQLVYTHP